MKLIVGLGNPGREYERTRHNAGAMAVVRWAEQHGWKFKAQKIFKSLLTQGIVGSQSVSALIPQTFMNLTGEAVAAVVTKKAILPENILVVYDDIALPLGRIRMKPQGSAGGHKGVASVMERLATRGFTRLRIGICGQQPRGDLAEYVLESFEMEERAEVDRMMDYAAEAIDLWIRSGIDESMNRCNAQRAPSGEKREESHRHE